MSVEVASVVPCENRLEVTLAGDSDGRSYSRILPQILGLAQSQQVRNVLVDCSQVTHPTVHILFEHHVAEFLARENPSGIQLAFIAPENGPSIRLVHFEVAARNRGVPVRVFQEKDEARKWLTRWETWWKRGPHITIKFPFGGGGREYFRISGVPTS